MAWLNFKIVRCPLLAGNGQPSLVSLRPEVGIATKIVLDRLFQHERRNAGEEW